MINIATNKHCWDPFLLHAIKLKQIVAVLHHVKRTFLAEFHRKKNTAVSVMDCVL